MNRVWGHELFWPSALVVVGVLFLIRNLGWLDWIRGDIFWPLVLIAIGFWFIARTARSRR